MPPEDRIPSKTTEDLALLMRYVQLSDTDLAELNSLADAFDGESESAASAFYEHLLHFPWFRPILEDPHLLDRLQMSQISYIRSLGDAELGDSYISRQARIGRAHENIGLPVHLFVGGYAYLFERLLPGLLKHAEIRDESSGQQQEKTPDPSKFIAILFKRILLDAMLAIEAHVSTREEHLVHQSEQLAAVGELSASIAHEIRNPLAGMRGAMEMLKRGRVAGRRRDEIINEVSEQIERMEGLVRDLLHFARPTAPSPVPLDVQASLAHAVAHTTQLADSTEIEVKIVVAPDATQVLADPVLFDQALLNLTHNAVQAMHSSGGTVQLSSRREGDAIVIEVRDNGPGIPPGALPRIFQPFFTTRHKGSGLGLPIVKKIMRAHGGEIELASCADAGTVVSLRFPRDR